MKSTGRNICAPNIDIYHRSKIGAEFYIELHGFYCADNALGQQIIVRRDGAIFRIDIPESADAFTFMRVGEPQTECSAPDPRAYTSNVALFKNSDNLVTIGIVRIVANADSALCADTFDRDDPVDMELFDREFNLLYRQATQLAQEFAERVAFQLYQDQIEPTGTYPKVLNLVELVDITVNRGFGISRGLAGVLSIIDPNAVVDASSLASVGAALAQEGPLAPDESLLVEARHVLRNSHATSPQRATLLVRQP